MPVFTTNSLQAGVGMSIANAKDVRREARRCHFPSLNSTLLLMALLGFGFAGMMAVGIASPLWKIGRAVIEWRAPLPRQAPPGLKIPVLKLSLRNEGGAGTHPVQIFGRWALQPAPPQHPFTLLGSYNQEVAWKQTAILEIPLTPLRGVPSARPPLEVVVMTGQQETDRKWIKLE